MVVGEVVGEKPDGRRSAALEPWIRGDRRIVLRAVGACCAVETGLGMCYGGKRKEPHRSVLKGIQMGKPTIATASAAQIRAAWQKEQTSRKMAICELCETAFKGKRRHARFCSDTCRASYARIKKQIEEAEWQKGE